MPVRTVKHVKGKFYCPNCGGELLTGKDTCLRCGGTLGKAADAAVPSGIEQTPEEAELSKGKHLPCPYCEAKHYEAEIEKNDGACPNCGADYYEKKRYTTPSSQPATTIARAEKYSEPKTSIKIPLWYYLVGITLFVFVVWGISALIEVANKKAERHDAVGYVTGSSWSTEIKTLRPYARKNESNYPVSGEGITPMPMYTAVVDSIPNPLPTYVTTEIVPGPTSMVEGPDRPCTDAEIAEYTTQNDDKSFNIPDVCFDWVSEPGVDTVETVVHEPMGTPTPVYGEIYPYIETGFEPGTPLTESGSGSEYYCPGLDRLPSGWLANSDDCLVSFSLTVMVGDGDNSETFSVSEDVYMANLNNRNLHVIVDGYGSIVEVVWP